jgi:hypothetical protein
MHTLIQIYLSIFLFMTGSDLVYEALLLSSLSLPRVSRGRHLLAVARRLLRCVILNPSALEYRVKNGYKSIIPA